MDTTLIKQKFKEKIKKNYAVSNLEDYRMEVRTKNYFKLMEEKYLPDAQKLYYKATRIFIDDKINSEIFSCAHSLFVADCKNGMYDNLNRPVKGVKA